jgi:hypothetical protein
MGKDSYGNQLKPEINAYNAVNNPNYTRDNDADDNVSLNARSFDGVDLGVGIYIHIRHVILLYNWFFYISAAYYHSFKIMSMSRNTKK